MLNYCGLLLLLLSPVVWPAVDASQYQQYWLWAGVRPQAIVNQAQRLYLLQGHIAAKQGVAAGFSRQGPLPTAKLSVPSLFLTYRVQSLNWDESVWQALRYQLASWQRLGIKPTGIQLDFDAATNGLAGYANFLRGVRAKLAPQYQLSVTGLLDWASSATPTELNSLAGVVDEVVFQTYRGRTSIPNYPLYLRKLARVQLPFKIGLVQAGDWQPQWEQVLAQSDWYRGVVVFLVNPRP